MNHHQKCFADDEGCFSCPLCKQGLSLSGASLVCGNNHCFDIARSGYVNLNLKPSKQKGYDKNSFQNRHYVLEQGLYQPILHEIVSFIKQRETIRHILDVGCGEGYYSKQIYQQTGRSIYAFDLSKDSVQLASKSDTASMIKWFVADLASIPLLDGSMDCLLNIFTPANYGEFHRILAPGGCIIKVVPTENHLMELRLLAENHLRNKEYSNQRVVDHFQRFFTCVSRKRITHTFQLSAEEKAAFIEMTPLLFRVDKAHVDWSALARLTVEAEVLIGTR